MVDVGSMKDSEVSDEVEDEKEEEEERRRSRLELRVSIVTAREGSETGPLRGAYGSRSCKDRRRRWSCPWKRSFLEPGRRARPVGYQGSQASSLRVLGNPRVVAPVQLRE